MNNKPSAKKASVVTIIFCILLIVGIVLTSIGAVNLNPSNSKVRNLTITFTGYLKASNLQSALETALEGSVVLNEVGKTTTTATTTTTKKATTTTAATTTTTATTTQGVAAAAETTTAATTTAAGTTTANGSTTTTTTKPTTTTASASDFRSGLMVATISNCDEKTNDEIVKILNETFAGKDYKGNNLVITSVKEVESIGGFSWTQAYACVILLIVVFVYCLIRYNSIGSAASAISAVVPAVVAVIGSVGAALICSLFASISISAVAAVATVAAVIFSIIILENVKAESNKDSSTVIGVAATAAVLLILAAIVGIIGWNGEVIFSCIQYAVAVVFAAIAALAYVRCMMGKLAKKAPTAKKGSGKKPVIR